MNSDTWVNVLSVNQETRDSDIAEINISYELYFFIPVILLGGLHIVKLAQMTGVYACIQESWVPSLIWHGFPKHQQK